MNLLALPASGTSELWSQSLRLGTKNTQRTVGSLPEAATTVNSLVGKNQTALLKPQVDESLPPEFRVLERAFDLKILASQYSIHLSYDRREKLFKEIDRLLDPTSWYDDDILLTQDSLRAFLRWTIYNGWKAWSALGVSNAGNLLVAWRIASDRVTAEVLPNDVIRWTASILQEGGVENAVGECVLKRFPAAIQSHLSALWN